MKIIVKKMWEKEVIFKNQNGNQTQKENRF